MRIRLTKPLPQPSIRKIIPSGVIIDAPEGLFLRLIREGRGEPVQTEKSPQEAVATPGIEKQTARKAVKHRGR